MPSLLQKLQKEDGNGMVKCLNPLKTYATVSTALLYEDDKKESQPISNDEIEIGDEDDERKIRFTI